MIELQESESMHNTARVLTQRPTEFHLAACHMQGSEEAQTQLYVHEELPPSPPFARSTAVKMPLPLEQGQQADSYMLRHGTPTLAGCGLPPSGAPDRARCAGSIPRSAQALRRARRRSVPAPRMQSSSRAAAALRLAVGAAKRGDRPLLHLREHQHESALMGSIRFSTRIRSRTVGRICAAWWACACQEGSVCAMHPSQLFACQSAWGNESCK